MAVVQGRGAADHSTRVPVTEAEDADCVPMSPLTPPTPALGF